MTIEEIGGETIGDLRRCVRDLVALSTLPAIWGDADRERIASRLLETVVPMVFAEVGCVRIETPAGPPLMVALEDSRLIRGAAAESLAKHIAAPIEGRIEAPVETSAPADGGLRVAAMPIGHRGGLGMLAVAARRDGFPAESERLLLRVAANQASVAFEARAAAEQLRRSERELSDFFENATMPIHWVGPDGRILRANRAELELLGYARDEYVGHHIAEFHADADVIEDMLRRLAAGETLHDCEARVRCKDGSIKRVLVDSNVRWEEGQFLNTRCFTRDVTERRRAEATARFLAEASAALVELLDYDSTLQRIAWLAVPGFSDWCAVDVVSPAGGLERLAVAHVDPERVRLARTIHESHGGWPAGGSHGPARVLATGEPEWVERVDDALLAEAAGSHEHLQALRQLGLYSYIAVPLRSRERAIGVLTFANAESRRAFDERDLQVAQDLAARVVIAIDNATMVHALREADRRKDEFLAILAHELRNPLAPLRNAVEILHVKGSSTPEVAWARNVIDRQLDQMARLVDDLLDVSRISRGKIELRRERLDLTAIASGVVESLREAIRRRGHELTVTTGDEALWVDGDAVRLAQVISNLLDNAAKFTARGGHIALAARREHDMAVVRVRDDGAGIPPEMLPRIFEMFTQVDRTLERSHGGLGIGLTLVQRLVEMHGGNVSAASDGPGRGSELVIRLPLAPAAESRPADSSPARPVPCRRVLVVDDNQDAADSLAMLLRLDGHDVATAYDGRAALDVAAKHLPELVLLDIGLPGLNGYEAARALRGTAFGRDAVLIALTGWGQEADRRRSREAGFDHHLTKPLDLAHLRQLLG